jgi:hypothetical protein
LNNQRIVDMYSLHGTSHLHIFLLDNYLQKQGMMLRSPHSFHPNIEEGTQQDNREGEDMQWGTGP